VAYPGEKKTFLVSCVLFYCSDSQESC